MKKGLFVCYDPHSLMQFLQFYCMSDFPAEWDVLCLPVEHGKGYMQYYCEKTRLFKNIFVGNVEYNNLSIFNKIKLFVPMFFCAIIGIKKRCCTHILNKFVGDINRYDILCSNIDTGFISGLLASFAKEKDVIYLEDGLGDYTIKRSWWKNSVYPFFSFINFQCVFMAWLGYFAKGYVYFKPTRYCYKYVTNKEILAYTNFKEIREFLLNEKTLQQYQTFLKIIYPELFKFYIPRESVIFFTDPLMDYIDDFKQYTNKIIEAISKKYKYVFIKKHPRDTADYVFPSNIKVTILNNHIPAEVFFPFMNGNVCCFDEISSVIIGLRPFVQKIIVYHIKDFDKMPLKMKPFTKAEKIKHLEKFMKDKYEIIEV